MSTVRFLSLFVLLGAFVGSYVVLGGGSDLREEALDRRLENLRRELIGAKNQENELRKAGQSRSLTDILEGLNRETDEEELEQKKSNTGEDGLKDLTGDDDDDVDVTDVIDGIFYIAASLADEIKATCNIDISAIFNGYSPATLSAANDANTKLCTATKCLSDALAAAPGFADDLKTFADSSTFKLSDVGANIDKAFAKLDKTLSTVEDKVFCAQAQLIAIRLQISLYGGVGFANGYLCNKVSVEFGRFLLNASMLLEASSSEEDFVRNCTRNLVEDITCYEKELVAYNKIAPQTPFTATSPLQSAAFTADFLIDYGVILMYHRIILSLEAEIVKLCASAKDNDNSDDNDDKREMAEEESLEEDTESLTDQLQKLLRKLNEVSAKKKEAQKALTGRTGAHANDKIQANGGTGDSGPIESRDKDTKDAMPSIGEKTAIKRSYYREREN